MAQSPRGRRRWANENSKAWLDECRCNDCIKPEHLAKSSDERSISQLVNIASMPGVVGEAWAMADWHFGYGFPIGGVLATDVNWGEEGGSISPGGVGFDINCG